jgi:hypothetical protein
VSPFTSPLPLPDDAAFIVANLPVKVHDGPDPELTRVALEVTLRSKKPAVGLRTPDVDLRLGGMSLDGFKLSTGMMEHHAQAIGMKGKDGGLLTREETAHIAHEREMT